MPKSKPLRVDEFQSLLEEDADFSDDLSDDSSIEIDDVDISDSDSDNVPYCDSDSDQVYNSQPAKKRSRKETMPSQRSDKIFEFNSDEIYGRNKFAWKTVENTTIGKTPARNIIKFKSGPTYQVGTAQESFNLFITDSMLDIIVKNTNNEIESKRTTYSKEHFTTSKTCIDEIKALFGILIKAAALKDNHLTTLEMWDTTNGRMWYRCIMSRDRFNFLLNCLRFDEKSTRLERKKTDSFAPIREIWDKFILNCNHNYCPSQNCTLDEQLLAFRGRCSFKMFIPNKPAKYGLKIVMLCDNESKYMFNAEPYLGKSTNTHGLPLSEYFTTNLTTPIFGSNRNVTMDNWFTSIPIAKKLLQSPYKLTLVGTLRKNKAEIPPELLILKKSEIGKAKFCFANELTLLSYQPKSNKNVLVLSTMHSGKDFNETKPEIIKCYNSTKGGVDAFDQMSSEMSCSRRTRRWPLCIFYGMLTTTIINSWIVYKENNLRSEMKIKRRKYALELANDLASNWIKKRYEIPNLPRMLKQEIKLLLGISQPSVNKELREKKIEQQRRCTDCLVRKNDRKTKILCFSCEKPICLEHKLSVCIDCIEKLE